MDPEVDVGLGEHRHAVRRLRRDVRHHEIRVTGRVVDGVRGEDRGPDAVRVLQVLVHPTRRREVRGVDLSSADEDRCQFAVDEVAVDAQRGERVVRADRLTPW